MVRIFIYLLAVLALGFGFAWIADRPGYVTVVWQGQQYDTSVMVAFTAIVVLVGSILLTWAIMSGIIRSPRLLARFFENRRRDRGYASLSRGLIAAGSGDAIQARRLAKESARLLSSEPLVGLLEAQTSLLEGKRDVARTTFQAMLGDDATRLVALRGLYIEAEREGEREAARQYAEEAAALSPSLAWAGNAKLRYQSLDGEWEAALRTLEANRAAGLVDRDTAKRHRAVLLTAQAIANEDGDPQSAARHAAEAVKLAGDLVPAAVVGAAALARNGDIRKASKLIETVWKNAPHPELAQAYVHIRGGDSALDRLKRARHLAGLNSGHPEGALAVAMAAVDARDWAAARKAMEPVLASHPSEQACMIMAEIEEAEHGDKGRMRDWLARAVRAPRNAVWTADGIVSDRWLPLSPVTARLDAFEWKVPVERLAGPDDVIEINNLTAPQSQPGEADGAETSSQTGKEPGSDGHEIEGAVVDVVEPKTDESPKTEETTSRAPAEAAGQGDEKNGSQAVFPLKRPPDDPGISGDSPPGERDEKGFKLF